MPKRPSPYPPEFRRPMIESVRSGRSPGEHAQKVEPSVQAILTRVLQADLAEGRREDGVMPGRAEPDRERRGWSE